MRITEHAHTRMQQRALHYHDLNLITEFGTEFVDGLVLRDRDVDLAVLTKKREIDRLEKLRGRALILNGENLITTYSPSKKRMKRFMRQRSE
jgi:hypothetical protein